VKMDLILLSAQDFFGQVTGATFGEKWVLGPLPMVILAVMTALIFYNILLMIARAFSMRQLEIFAKSEMMQSLATAFMAASLVVMVGGGMEMASHYIAGDVSCGGEVIHIPYADDDVRMGQTAMENAFDAIRCRLQSRAKEVSYIQGAVIEDAMNTFNALNLGLNFFGVTFFKGDWSSSLYKEAEQMRITNNLATTIILGLNAQSTVLAYIKGNMLTIFLPVGILLRSFYFTRGVGALFIAIAIGMYYIFPVFFVILDPGFTPSPPPEPREASSATKYCYPTMSNAISLLQTVEASGAGSTSGLMFANLGNDLTKSYTNLILHPLISFFLTLTFIRYIMSVMGGDTVALSRMVTKVI